MTFAITRHKGVSLRFDNGWAISIQWGPGNFCSRRDAQYDSPKHCEVWESRDAEIAIFTPSGDFFEGIYGGDDVAGQVDANTVAWVMNRLASFGGDTQLQRQELLAAIRKGLE